MDDVLTLPDHPMVSPSLSLARAHEEPPVFDHSVRSFLFARQLATQEGSDGDAAYDELLLFLACVLHDLGLGDQAPARARFEVEGADLAGDFLEREGLDRAGADRVWEAIALHSSIGLADHMGLLTQLTHRGVFTDGGRFTDLAPERARPIREAYPRAVDDTSIRDAIIRHARRSEAAAPPYSIAADLLRLAGDGPNQA